MQFASIEDAAADIREGRMIIVVDDEDRENEGDLVCAAEKITPEIINFMATHARGLICTSDLSASSIFSMGRGVRRMKAATSVSGKI